MGMTVGEFSLAVAEGVIEDFIFSTVVDGLHPFRQSKKAR
jgi:hypothetical protein